MPVRVVLVLLGVALIGTLALFNVLYRRGEASARESARELACFPLELPEPRVYRITKSLTRQVVSERFGSTETAKDEYFSRLTVTPGKPHHIKVGRSEKCGTLAMALATRSESKTEELVEGDDGVRFADTGLLLLPPITPLKPATFSLTFGLTREGNGYFGWPLLEVIGMTDQENRLYVELADASGSAPVFVKPEPDRQTVFNVEREESVHFFQSPGEVVTIAGAPVQTQKLDYRGHLTQRNSFHEIAGAIWLAPKMGVVKEQREVRFKIYARDRLDEKKGDLARPHSDAVTYEASVTKVLAHPL